MVSAPPGLAATKPCQQGARGYRHRSAGRVPVGQSLKSPSRAKAIFDCPQVSRNNRIIKLPSVLGRRLGWFQDDRLSLRQKGFGPFGR